MKKPSLRVCNDPKYCEHEHDLLHQNMDFDVAMLHIDQTPISQGEEGLSTNFGEENMPGTR